MDKKSRQYEATKRWRAKDPKRAKDLAARNKIMLKYGMDYLQFSALVISQSGRCANTGCNTPLKNPHVDHDHADGKVRGLLCVNCNQALGHAKESVARLQGLVDYIQKFAV